MPSKLKAIQNIAQNRGGTCLSTEYQGSNRRLLFQCAHGHKWQATPSSIKNNRWCPTCALEKNAQSQDIYISVKLMMKQQKISFDTALKEWIQKHPTIACTRLNIKKRIIYYAEKNNDWSFVCEAKRSFRMPLIDNEKTSKRVLSNPTHLEFSPLTLNYLRVTKE